MWLFLKPWQGFLRKLFPRVDSDLTYLWGNPPLSISLRLSKGVFLPWTLWRHSEFSLVAYILTELCLRWWTIACYCLGIGALVYGTWTRRDFTGDGEMLVGKSACHASMRNWVQIPGLLLKLWWLQATPVVGVEKQAPGGYWSTSIAKMVAFQPGERPGFSFWLQVSALASLDVRL